MKKNNNGFTLVELIAVIVLIALLFVVAIPAAMKVGDNAKKKSFETKLNLIKSAGELYGQKELKVLQTETNSFCKIEGDKITTSETQIDEAYYPCFKKTVGELLQKGMIDRDDYYNCSSGLIDVIYNPVTENTINQCNVYIYFKNNKPSAIYDINDDCEIPVSELCGVSPRTSKSLVLNTSTTTTQPAVSCEYSAGHTWDYYGDPVMGSPYGQEWIAPCTATYKIEAWGAEGHSPDNSSDQRKGGKGSYVAGNIHLSKSTKLYFDVGLSANSDNRNSSVYTCGMSDCGGWNGGGSTSVRITPGLWSDFDSLKSRIMVAAGGGVAYQGGTPGDGGGLVGYAGGGTAGGTQTSAPASQSTSYAASTFGIANGGCTGGNGYYPGGGATCASGSGGGSSFISGHNGCDAISEASTSSNIIHTGQPNHFSGYIFTNTVMIDGKGCSWTNVKGSCSNQPQPNGSITTGHQSHGNVRVTLISFG